MCRGGAGSWPARLWTMITVSTPSLHQCSSILIAMLSAYDTSRTSSANLCHPLTRVTVQGGWKKKTAASLLPLFSLFLHTCASIAHRVADPLVPDTSHTHPHWMPTDMRRGRQRLGRGLGRGSCWADTQVRVALCSIRTLAWRAISDTSRGAESRTPVAADGWYPPDTSRSVTQSRSLRLPDTSRSAL
jgi:hypothetical protein